MSKKINKNSIVVKENYKGGTGAKPIEDLIEKYQINTDLYYVDSFKIKDSTWQVAALKRDQDLVWQNVTQTKTFKDADEKVEGIQTTDNVQMMTGHGKRYPEFIVNDNTAFGIEVTFKRLPLEWDILESFKEFVKDMPDIKPAVKRTFKKRIIKTGVAAEMATVDAHLGKLAWEKETGYRNFDLTIAREDYQYITEKGLDYAAPHKPELIVDIVGNDLYHIDNMEGKTTHGSHSMDVDGRMPKIHKKVLETKIKNIYQYRKLAPVRVIWIPGNHDFVASLMLCSAINEHFRNDPRVTVDLGENPRKAMLWGKLLVGWNHAIKGKYSVWVNELPQQFPKLWGDSIFREWHCGDQHKKVTTKLNTPVNTVGGVIIRQMTALSPVDKWHAENVFTDAVPGGETLMWSKEEGVFAQYTLWTGQYDDHRNKLINQK